MALGAWAVSGIVARLRRRRHRITPCQLTPSVPAGSYLCRCGQTFAACSPNDNRLLAESHAELHGGELVEQ